MDVAMNYLKSASNLRIGYFSLIVVRFLWTLLPQSGYIFPDEFFQSPEIMAKDFLSLNTTTTWEWDETFPMRSPVSAFLSSGIPYMVLNMLHYFKLIKMTSYLLLVFPRIFMTLISVLSFDIPVYVLCRRLNLDPFLHLFVLSTSYVTPVFGTRTLSNVLETGCFGVLLVLLVIPRGKVIARNNDASKETYEEERITKMNCFLAGSVTSLGFFCRQTFLGFAIAPYMGWLTWHLKSQWSFTKIIKVIIQIIFMSLGFFLVSTFIILVDSWYFQYLQKGNIIFTFWNSMKYNAMKAHTHGHHPFFTHFFVNIPLLFGPVAFILYFELIMSFFKWRNTFPHDLSHESKQDYIYYWHLVLLFSVLVPVFFLSFIPHQEPRFIMPIIIPLILLFSQTIVGSNDSPTFLCSWFIWNVIGGLFFGVLHQGGVVPSLVYLEKVIKNNTESLSLPYCHHIVYLHTYMPPRHLLVWPEKNAVNGSWLYLHDLAGSPEEIFHETKSRLKDYCHENTSMLYVLCPGTIKIGVENLENVVSFFPHLSMEDPPDFNRHLTQLIFGNTAYIDDQNEEATLLEGKNMHKINTYFGNLIHQLQEIKAELSLFLYILKI